MENIDGIGRMSFGHRCTSKGMRDDTAFVFATWKPTILNGGGSVKLIQLLKRKDVEFNPHSYSGVEILMIDEYLAQRNKMLAKVANFVIRLLQSLDLPNPLSYPASHSPITTIKIPHRQELSKVKCIHDID